jgi:hypothetical protein
MEIERAKRDTASLRDWQAGIRRTIATGVLTFAAFAIAGWPDGATAAWITLGVAVVALGLVLLGEFGWNLALAPLRMARENNARLRDENAALKATAVEVEQVERMREQERALFNRELADTRRTLAIAEVDIHVWGGAYAEGIRGRLPPLAAIMARREKVLKARNLDAPLPQQRDAA